MKKLSRIFYSYEEKNYYLLRFKNINKNNDSNIDLNKILSYNYITHNLKEDTIFVHKEILRSIIIKNLINLFIKEIRNFKDIKNLGKIFKYNKLEEYVQKWCWLQYENQTLKDSVIPYVENQNYNFDEFIFDFNYILNYNITKDSINIKKLINKIKLFLNEEYNKFKQTKFQILSINKIRNIENVILSCLYNNKEYSITINNNLYIRLYKKFINSDINNIDSYIFCLIFRYSYIDAENQQLAIHKKIKELFKNYGVNFELYGSAINVLSDYYCSLFYDIEKYFGSQGNFFDIEIKSGIYWCNPPYINELMKNTALKLIDIMNNNINTAFIITIPIWDKMTQEHNFTDIIRNYNKNTFPEDHNDYPIYSLLKPYIKDELIIPKNKIPYFNYRYYKPINASNTYMLIVYKNLSDEFKKFHNVFDQILVLNTTNYFQLNN